MIADFLGLFRLSRNEWTKRCEELFNSLRTAGLLSQENKFSLTADKLDEAIVLEKILSMD